MKKFFRAFDAATNMFDDNVAQRREYVRRVVIIGTSEMRCVSSL